MQALKTCIILYCGRIHPQVLEQHIVCLGKKKKINVRMMMFSIFITLCCRNAFPSTFFAMLHGLPLYGCS